MPISSPSYVKNIVRRCLFAMIDPELRKTDRTAVWEYFASKCAYCGRRLRARREGRMDHLVAFKDGGGNYLRNRVLACRSCNDEQKRDQRWEGFLREKSPDRITFAKRKKRIKDWKKLNPPPANRSKRLKKAVQQAADEVCIVFDKKVSEVEAVRDRSRKRS